MFLLLEHYLELLLSSVKPISGVTLTKNSPGTVTILSDLMYSFFVSNHNI